MGHTPYELFGWKHNIPGVLQKGSPEPNEHDSYIKGYSRVIRQKGLI